MTRTEEHQRIQWSAWLRSLVVAAALAVLFWPALLWLWREWWSNEFYSHGPLVPLVSAFLAWRLWPGVEARPATSGLGLMAAGLGLHVGGLAWRAPFISALALPVVLAGLVAFAWGWAALRRMLFPLAFLGMMVPLPFVEAASVPLQRLAATGSAVLARLLGVPVQQAGGSLRVQDVSLVVGAPCSGLRSAVTLLALGWLLAWLVQGRRDHAVGCSWLARLALLCFSVPVAVAANLLRVTGLILVASRWGRPAGMSFHDWSGPFFFALALAGLIGLSWGLGCREIRSDI